MAQAGYTPIELYYSTSAGVSPSAGNLKNGELALNITDGKLFYKDNLGVVKLLASNSAATPVTTFSAGTTGFTPSVATNGAVTLTGTLSIANGGTGQTSASAAFNALSPVTTTGDLIIGNGPNSSTRLPIGANTYILTSNGTTATWSAPASSMVYPGAGIPNSTGSAWGTSYTTSGTGTVVALATTPTLTDPAITGTILEDIYTITDGAAFEVDPGNGSIQLITLGANRTPKATNFTAGKAITLMVDDGSAYTITWTDSTWGTSGVVWLTNSGSAPTLATTGYTAIALWKVGTQVYGARVGNNA